MLGLFIGGGRHQDEGLETHLTGQEAMAFPSPTTHVKEGRTAGPTAPGHAPPSEAAPGALEVGLVPQGGRLL